MPLKPLQLGEGGWSDVPLSGEEDDERGCGGGVGFLAGCQDSEMKDKTCHPHFSIPWINSSAQTATSKGYSFYFLLQLHSFLLVMDQQSTLYSLQPGQIYCLPKHLHTQDLNVCGLRPRRQHFGSHKTLWWSWDTRKHRCERERQRCENKTLFTARTSSGDWQETGTMEADSSSNNNRKH